MKEGADQNTMNRYQGTFVYDGEGLEGCQRNKEQEKTTIWCNY